MSLQAILAASRAPAGTFERNRSIDVAADDPQLGELGKRLPSRFPKPVLESCFGYNAHARRDEHVQDLEEQGEEFVASTDRHVRLGSPRRERGPCLL